MRGGDRQQDAVAKTGVFGEVEPEKLWVWGCQAQVQAGVQCILEMGGHVKPIPLKGRFPPSPLLGSWDACGPLGQREEVSSLEPFTPKERPVCVGISHLSRENSQAGLLSRTHAAL